MLSKNWNRFSLFIQKRSVTTYSTSKSLKAFEPQKLLFEGPSCWKKYGELLCCKIALINEI